MSLSNGTEAGLEQTIGVVGTGLLGASLIDLIFEENPDASVGCYEPNQSHRDKVREEFSRLEICDDLEELSACSVILVCTPPGVAAELIVTLLNMPESDALIIDTASTKSAIVRNVAASGADASRYFAGHPLAGGNDVGPSAANAGKIRGSTFILSRTPANAQDDYDRIKRFLENLDFEILCLDAEKHDEIIALTSHLPHLIGYAFAASLAELSDDDSEKLEALASRSTRSVAQFASENAIMWADIFGQNGNLSFWVDTFIAKLLELRGLATEGERAALVASLSAAHNLANDIRLKDQ